MALSLHLGPALAATPLFNEDGNVPCAANCPRITRAGDAMVVALLDQQGKVFKTQTYAIAPGATKIEVDRERASTTLQLPEGTTGPVTTRSASTTITTATQQILFTQIFYYADGKLIDVKIVDQVFAR
ncbi:MAG TPA: hypothetical protein VGC21_25830 [Telluria sp.]